MSLSGSQDAPVLAQQAEDSEGTIEEEDEDSEEEREFARARKEREFLRAQEARRQERLRQQVRAWAAPLSPLSRPESRPSPAWVPCPDLRAARLLPGPPVALLCLRAACLLPGVPLSGLSFACLLAPHGSAVTWCQTAACSAFLQSGCLACMAWNCRLLHVAEACMCTLREI